MKATDAYQLLDAVRVGRLATLRPDGAPHLVPIVFALVDRTLATAIDGKRKSDRTPARIDNIALDPRVTFLADHYDEDWSRLWWVRIDGQAAVLHSGDYFNRALAALRQRYDQYRQVALEGPVIRVTIERISGWRAS